MNNIKKNLWLIPLILVIVGAGVFLVYQFAFHKQEESKLIDIQVSDFVEKIESKDTLILVVSQTGCSHCEQYLPELDRTLKEKNLNAYVLNITNLSKEESATLSKYVNFSGTPTTIFFRDGVEKTTLNRIVGYASKNKIIERLQALGYID